MAQKFPTSTSSQPTHHNYAALFQSTETLLNNISVMPFIGFSIKCYPLNFVPQALDIPKHVFTPNQSNLVLFYTRGSQYLTIKKIKKSKTFFHFSAITCRIINKTNNPNFSKIFYNVVGAHSSFISLLIYTTISMIPTIPSLS